jgi:hypothetical protein
MVCGTRDEAWRAIRAFETIVHILPDIANFNAPEGTPIEELEELRFRLQEAHEEIVELTRGNEVYDWLGLTNDAARTLRTVEDKAFPFPFLREKNLVNLVGDDLSQTIVRACGDGHLPVARSLYSLGGVDIHAENDLAFRRACLWGRLSMAQWLHSLGGVDIHAHVDCAFGLACGNGRLETAQWLHSLGGVDIHAKNDVTFRDACVNGHLATAQWLHSLGGIDIHAHDDHAFRFAREYDEASVVNWLRDLGCGP